ncbi:ABC transporter substrate-binding protein [Methanospirillum sp.]|uniref:ABC transporter substrate-binding protein n=1 Tax=Methanospirillum sp. TaxID=45200 RepID=UPI00359F9463
MVIFALTITGTGDSRTESESSDKISELVLVGPPGPMAIPLAYLAENNKLNDIAEKTTLKIWENQDQLLAMINGGDTPHFVTMPSNTAATLYNKGIDLKSLDISVWGILYVISTDPSIKSIKDLTDHEVIVPFEGAMPDLLFNNICQKTGIDTSKDLSIYYASTPQQTAQLLLAGQKNCAVLTEPLATQVILKGKKAGTDFYRSINLQEEWNKATGLGDRIPIAGTVAMPKIMNNPDAIKKFMEEYSLAIDWLKNNPDEAGDLGSQIEKLGFEAKPIAESVKNTRWDFVRANECKEDIETFFTVLAEQNPKIIGGKLPDSGYYYQ